MGVEYYDLRGALLFTEKWRVDLKSGALEGPNLKKTLDDQSLHFRSRPVNRTRKSGKARMGFAER